MLQGLDEFEFEDKFLSKYDFFKINWSNSSKALKIILLKI